MFEKIMEIAKSKGINSMYKLSKTTGIGQDVISRWSSGKTKPSIDSLLKIAKALDVELTKLL